MRMLLAIAVLAASAIFAEAQDFRLLSHGFISCGRDTCVWDEFAPSAEPRIIHVRPNGLTGSLKQLKDGHRRVAKESAS